MSDPRILTVRPEPGEYAYTFGGAPPVARIAPGTVLDLYTEDCFGGRVRSEKDLVSQVCELPFLNPQTGPFHIEEPNPVTRSRCTSCPSNRPATGQPPRRSRCSARSRPPTPRPHSSRRCRGRMDVAPRPGATHRPVHRARQRPPGRAADGSDARNGRRGAREPRGPLGPGPGRARRQHGLAGDARGRHLLSRGECRGRAAEPR